MWVLAWLCMPLAAFAADTPYAGQEQRSIKALSDRDVQNLLAGKGMGFAKAAELNHYPGPAHVLELAAKLRLSPDQERKTRDIFSAMQKEAMRLGQQLVDRERALDQSFANGSINPETLRTQLNGVGAMQAELRRVHLQAHLDQRALLTDEQVRVYDKLRGYGAGGTGHQHDGHTH